MPSPDAAAIRQPFDRRPQRRQRRNIALLSVHTTNSWRWATWQLIQSHMAGSTPGPPASVRVSRATIGAACLTPACAKSVPTLAARSRVPAPPFASDPSTACFSPELTGFRRCHPRGTARPRARQRARSRHGRLAGDYTFVDADCRFVTGARDFSRCVRPRAVARSVCCDARVTHRGGEAARSDGRPPASRRCGGRSWCSARTSNRSRTTASRCDGR